MNRANYEQVANDTAAFQRDLPEWTKPFRFYLESVINRHGLDKLLEVIGWAIRQIEESRSAENSSEDVRRFRLLTTRLRCDP